MGFERLFYLALHALILFVGFRYLTLYYFLTFDYDAGTSSSKV